MLRGVRTNDTGVRTTPEVLRWLFDGRGESHRIPAYRLPHVARALTAEPPPELTHEDRWEIPVEARSWLSRVLRRAVVAAGGGSRELDRLRLVLAAVWADADLYVRHRDAGLLNWDYSTCNGSCPHGWDWEHTHEGPDPLRWTELYARYQWLGGGAVVETEDGYDVVPWDEIDDEDDPLNVAGTRDVIQDLVKHEGADPADLAGVLGAVLYAVESLSEGDPLGVDPLDLRATLAEGLAGVTAAVLSLVTPENSTANSHGPPVAAGLDSPAVGPGVMPTGPPAAVRTTPNRVLPTAA